MVRPDGFGFDFDTAEDNGFQSPDSSDVSGAVHREFDRMVESLLEAGITVEVRDAPPECPSAVFPNNWFSTHENGSLFVYPLRAKSRRLERSGATLAWLKSRWPSVVDLSGFELEGEYLEGTGSLVLDRTGGNAFVARSPRSHERLVELWCEQTGFRPIVFDAASPDGRAVYHTNVVLALGTGWAVACLEAVPDRQRSTLRKIIAATHRELVEVTWSQLEAMACNLLELHGDRGPVIVGGEAAFASLDPRQLAVLEGHGGLLPVSIPTIERVGGGGARCAMAELFDPIPGFDEA